MRYENPFYMVEDAGAADLIAGGRLQLGISRGSPEQVIDGWRHFGQRPAEGESDAEMGRHHAEEYLDLLRGDGFARPNPRPMFPNPGWTEKETQILLSDGFWSAGFVDSTPKILRKSLISYPMSQQQLQFHQQLHEASVVGEDAAQILQKLVSSANRELADEKGWALRLKRPIRMRRVSDSRRALALAMEEAGVKQESFVGETGKLYVFRNNRRANAQFHIYSLDGYARLCHVGTRSHAKMHKVDVSLTGWRMDSRLPHVSPDAPAQLTS